MLLIDTRIFLQTMLHNSDGAMLSRLLWIFVLCSFCSAMLLNNTGTVTAADNTIPWPGSGSDPGWDSESSSNSGEERPSPLIPNPRQGLLQLPEEPPVNQTMPFLPDTSICDVLLSAPTPPPINEIPFFCLCSHCQGTVGPKGDRGDRGLPGLPGSPGRRGMMGFPGRPGFTGAPGMKGQKGDIGEKGMSGSVGLMGMKGQRGFKGEKGDRGSSGLQGPQGPQGETGICPASCDSVPGPPGEQGPSGPGGARGLPGVKGERGAMGFKGDKGDLGVPGNPGLDGQKGDQGVQGVCECTDGSDGSKGDRGMKGDKGDKGDAGARGAQGDLGPKGDVGAMGLMGLPGPCSPNIKSAFSAALNESFPIPNFPVAFYNIFENEQRHFDPSGIYTAPVNGTYVFSFNLAVAERTLKVGLFRNFFPVLKVTEGNEQSSTSQTIVLHLNMLDRLWLQVKSATTNGMYTDGESSSTFSGMLLYPDSCEMPLGRHHSPPALHDDFGWDGPLSGHAP